MRRRRRFWTWAAVLVLVAGAGYGVWRWQRDTTTPTTQEPSLQTSVARRGSIVLAATGVGSLIPVAERALTFPVAGSLLTLDVQVGDRVRSGQSLASIDDAGARLSLSQAEVQLAQAQRELTDAQAAQETLLAGPTDSELAAARLAVLNAEQRLADLTAGPSRAEIAAAEATLANAQARYAELQAQPDPLTVERAKLSLDRARNSLWSTQMSRDATCGMDKHSNACNQAEVSVLNAEISVRTAEMDYDAAQQPASQLELVDAQAAVLRAQEALTALRAGPTEAERLAAENELATARANLAEMEAAPTAEDLATAELRLRQAELTLAQAERQLAEAQAARAGCTLVAPFDGVVTAVSRSVGEEVGTGAGVVTVADLSRYVLEIMVDESDMATLTIGREVEVVFDALPEQTFAGKVVQVNPSLTSSGGLSLLSGLVELDAGGLSKPQGLPLGLAATVDVIGGRAENVVLVPVEALREIEPGSYAVFVVENGEPRLRLVEVGLMDLTYAEIIAGVEAGEIVSTGMVATQ